MKDIAGMVFMAEVAVPRELVEFAIEV